MENEWVLIIVRILSGLAAAIPLVCALINYVKKTVKEKNWPDVVDKVMNLMAVAEEKFATGAERKEWVLAMLKAGADSINYDIDYQAISDLIDALCDMSKAVNNGKSAQEV